MNIKELEQKIIDLGLGWIEDKTNYTMIIFDHDVLDSDDYVNTNANPIISINYGDVKIKPDFSMMGKQADLSLDTFTKLLQLLSKFEDTRLSKREIETQYVLKLGTNLYLKERNQINVGFFDTVISMKEATKYTNSQLQDLVTCGYIGSDKLLKELMEEYKEDENDEH